MNRLSRFLILLALGWAAFGQTAAYPTAVVGDSQLTVAANDVQTTTTAFMGASDTSFTVSSASLLAANMLLTVDYEIVHVCGISGTTVKVGVSSCPNIDGRGFDNTMAVTHNALASVSADTDAWHHNAVKAELEAIENSLGANLVNILNLIPSPTTVPHGGTGLTAGSQLGYLRTTPNTGNNTTYQFVLGQTQVSSDFNYSGLTPSSPSTLTGGAGAQTIAVPVCPLGIYSSVTSSWAPVYLTAGSGGTAEGVTPSGGTCSAALQGIGGGTIIVAPANNHGTGYTLATATGGIVEAFNFLPSGGGTVAIAPGIWPIYTTIAFPTGAHITLRGAGRGNTILSTSYTGGPIISLSNPSSSTLEDFEIDGPSTGTNYAISMNTGWFNVFHRLKLTNVWNGVSLTGELEENVFRDIEIDLPGGGTGVYGLDTAGGDVGNFDDVFVQCVPTIANSIAFNIVAGGGIWFKRAYGSGCANGLVVNPGSGQVVADLFVDDMFFDMYATNENIGVHLSPASGSVLAIAQFHNLSTSGSYAFVIDGAGVQGDYVVDSSYFLAAKNNGVFVAGSNVTNVLFSNDTVQNNGTSATGTLPGMLLNSGTNITVRGGTYAPGVFATLNTQDYAIYASGTTNLVIDGVNGKGNVTGAFFNGGSNTNLRVTHFDGYNPVGQSSITVGASGSTYTSGASPETVYVQGGTITSITLGGHTITNTTIPTGQSLIIPLAPNTSFIYNFSAAPTMFRDVQ